MTQNPETRRRILVLGTGPLLEDPRAKSFSGQCLRTMHFVRPLREAGHDVVLMTLPIAGYEDPTRKEPATKPARTDDGFAYREFTTADKFRIRRVLERVFARETFDAAVGVNQFPAYCLALAEPPCPFWADLNGWTMAEGQTHHALVEHDWDYEHFWQMEAVPLLEADRFSTASARQAHALYGELAMLGRLQGATFDWPFASAVPNAVYRAYSELQRTADMPEHEGLRDLPENPHLVLWSGSFNTWMDGDLLIEGLKRAMKREPRLVFVATGGVCRGHDELSFVRFRDRAAAELPEGRVRLLGWVESELVLQLHARADVGLNIDALNTETMFGARNRLTNMMGAGLPVLTTRGTEIADWIETKKAGAVVPLGDREALAAALVDSAVNRDRWMRRARKARKAAQKAFAPEATLPEFLAWCADPLRAPDREFRGTVEEPGAAEWARIRARGDAEGVLRGNASYHALRRKAPLRLWYRLKELTSRR